MRDRHPGTETEAREAVKRLVEKVYGSVAGGTVFGGDAQTSCSRALDARSTPMTAMEGSLFEYACHEGNYSLPLILSGSRTQGTREAR